MSALALAFNTEIYAASQYLNFPFNSMCEFGGVLLGASEDGIFQLETGGRDGESPIDSLVEFPNSDLGVSYLKHVRRVDIKGKAQGNLLLTVSADDGPEIVRTIQVRTPGRHSTMWDYLTREQRGMYFLLRLENVDGAYFSINAIDLHIIPIATRETPA